MFGIFTVLQNRLFTLLGGNLSVGARISGISIERISVAVIPYTCVYYWSLDIDFLSRWQYFCRIGFMTKAIGEKYV